MTQLLVTEKTKASKIIKLAMGYLIPEYRDTGKEDNDHNCFYSSYLCIVANPELFYTPSNSFALAATYMSWIVTYNDNFELSQDEQFIAMCLAYEIAKSEGN